MRKKKEASDITIPCPKCKGERNPNYICDVCKGTNALSILTGKPIKYEILQVSK